METQNKKKALGRGLEELFNIEDINYGSMENLEKKIVTEAKEEEIVEIPLSELRVNPYQPRKFFDEEKLQELATSIKEYGVFQPIIVKESIKGYEIVAGERRFRASKLAGKATIPSIVRNFTDDQMMQIAVLENLQREDLNPIEEADAYKKLMDNLNLTQEELAEKLGKSRSHITNMIGMLRLPEKVKETIKDGKISMGHARVLSKLEDETKIEYLTKEIISKGLSVRALEELTKENTYKKVNKINRKETTNEYTELEKNLENYLGTKVKIQNSKMIINFTNTNDINRILEIIKYNK